MSNTTTTSTEAATVAQQKQAEARETYQQSLAAEMPLTGKKLGAMFEKSPSWGRARIAEVKEATEAAAEVVDEPADVIEDEGQEDEPEPPLAAAVEVEETPTEREASADLTPNARTGAAVEAPAIPEWNERSTSEFLARPEADQAPELAPTVEAQKRQKPLKTWPVWLLMLPATVAIWGGWVGLGKKAGFGEIAPLPGIFDSFTIDTAITLPIGMEVYASYALYVWLSGKARGRALVFAKRSAIISLTVGALGQIAYHVMEAAKVPNAPWWITAAVACLPVAVLGLGAALAHTVKAEQE